MTNRVLIHEFECSEKHDNYITRVAYFPSFTENTVEFETESLYKLLFLKNFKPTYGNIKKYRIYLKDKKIHEVLRIIKILYKKVKYIIYDDFETPISEKEFLELFE